MCDHCDCGGGKKSAPATLSPQQVQCLREAVSAFSSNPSLLADAKLDFFRSWLTSLGARVPSAAAPSPPHAHPAAHPPHASSAAKPVADPIDDDDEMPPLVDESDQPIAPEEPAEPDDGRIPAESDAPLAMGTPGREVSDDQREKAATERSAGVEAQNAGRFDEALRHFTAAIELSPTAPFYAFRAACCLAAKKPNAAIRDADAALALNPDNSRALKTRGKALRALGRYEEAQVNLAAGQRADFDENTEETLKWVIARVKSQHERKAKQQQQQKSQAKPASASSSSSSSSSHTNAGPGFGGGAGFPNMAGAAGGGLPSMPPGFDPSTLLDPEVMAMLQNPGVMEKLQGMMSGTVSMADIAADPQLAPLVAKLSAKFGGAGGGGGDGAAM